MSPVAETKRCSRCGLVKPLDEFYPSPQGKQGRKSICKVCTETQRRQYRRDHPESYRGAYSRTGRKAALKAHFGMTLEDYEAKLAGQNGVCAVCHKTTAKRLAVDHDHATQQIRGLLCHRCNLALGLFDDNKLLMLRAVRYLEEHGA